MNLQQAKNELAALAHGEYHVIKYELTEFGSGKQQQECVVYIHGHGFFSGPTFKQALGLLKKAMDPKRHIDKPQKPQQGIAEDITDAPRTTVQQYIDRVQVAA